MERLTIGVSLKAYFEHERARTWFVQVARRVAPHPAVASGAVRFFVVPTYLQIPAALETFRGTPIEVGSQDVSQFEPGAQTGEVTAAELAEVGVTLAEVGHAERRTNFAETDSIVAAKAALARSHGMTPLLCIGETKHLGSAEAAHANAAQLRRDLDGVPPGPVIVAYEPVWAIGAAHPAPFEHVAVVAEMIRAVLDESPARLGSAVIYGGSAGPGLLARLVPAVDGLFLGRSAHDIDAVLAVLDETVTSVPR